MRKIGIVYAISRAAGEHCKKQFVLMGYSSSEIVTHEYPADAYKAAANDIQQISKLVCHSIDKLVIQGAEVIVVAANSVHCAFEAIDRYVRCKYSTTQVISIIESAIRKAVYLNLRNVVILGSNSTIQSKIYHDKLKQSGINVLPLLEKDQSFINSLITSGVTADVIRDDIKMSVTNIVRKFAGVDSIGIILACTELSVSFNSKSFGITTIDAGHELVLEAHRRIEKKYECPEKSSMTFKK